MEFRRVTITLETGLQDRYAAGFVQLASQFTSEIQIQYKQMKLNAKSFMGVLCMDLRPGTGIVLGAEGKDAAAALNALEAFLNP